MSPEIEAAIIQVAGVWALELEKNKSLPQEEIEKTLLLTFERLRGQLHSKIGPRPVSYSSVKDLRKE